MLNIKDYQISASMALLERLCLKNYFVQEESAVNFGTSHGVEFSQGNRDKIDGDFVGKAEGGQNDPRENPFHYAESPERLEKIISEIIDFPERIEEFYDNLNFPCLVERVFHMAVVKAYGGRCAICSLSLTECLVGTYIIPWPYATRVERLSPTNGICLCANHRHLFIRGLITIDATGRIVSGLDQSDCTSASDRALSLALHGKQANLPNDAALCPSKKALNFHYGMLWWHQ